MELYKVLLAEGYRILTIDYRGFGDSSDTSEAENSMVEDARSEAWERTRWTWEQRTLETQQAHRRIAAKVTWSMKQLFLKI